MSDLIPRLERLAKLTQSWDANVGRKTRNEITEILLEAAGLMRDYEDVLADKRRLTRELDVAMHGEEGAAQQASLCDLIGPAKQQAKQITILEARDAAWGLQYGEDIEELVGVLKAVGVVVRRSDLVELINTTLSKHTQKGDEG